MTEREEGAQEGRRCCVCGMCECVVECRIAVCVLSECMAEDLPPVDTRNEICISLIQITARGYPVLFFLVTPSTCQDWIICAPAAFQRSGGRFSGSLPRIEL